MKCEHNDRPARRAGEQAEEANDTYDGDRMSQGWADMWDAAALEDALRRRRTIGPTVEPAPGGEQ